MIICIKIEAISKQYFQSLPIGIEIIGHAGILKTDLMDSIIRYSMKICSGQAEKPQLSGKDNNLYLSTV